jgi:signal transduction histidine kinase
MIDQISFQTAARTVDHLGREQIADTPTAISELWKNAYDAYARSVELNLYDGVSPVAALLDDGHGMNRDDFVGRWLVVGTQSKILADTTSVAERNGLPIRPRQGQKGIGRLSCANLAPILLFVSKRSAQPYVAALVDWRLFENPFLTLGDIRLPVVEFDRPSDLLPQLPMLSSQLLQNIEGGTDPAHSARVKAAWSSFDALHTEEVRLGTAVRSRAPSAAVREDISKLTFSERHFGQWDAWTGASDHGTALLMSGLTYDLTVQIQETTRNSIAKTASKKLIETLSSFVDPFVDPAHPEINAVKTDFHYAVRVWRGERPQLIVGSDRQFDRHTVEPMEHRLEGRIGADGVFRGRVKAFGEWVDGECVIDPPADLGQSGRSDTVVGPIDVFIASMEFAGANTTHTQQEFVRFKDLAEQFSGFLMFRDGLRVMPYGRPDNDFFEIESRRTRSAGREFWNQRQMFGRLAISRARNPNLKDKAGREGLVDNSAAKTLKSLVENILKESARTYFGSASSVRADLLPEIRNANAREKAATAREKLKARQRAEFRTKLSRYLKEAIDLSNDVHRFAVEMKLDREQSIINAQTAIENLQDRFLRLDLGEPPKPLGTMEEGYGRYRREMGSVQRELQESVERLRLHVSTFQFDDPFEILERQVVRNRLQVKARVDGWRDEIKALQTDERMRIEAIIATRQAAFSSFADPLLDRLRKGEVEFVEATRLVEEIRIRVDRENADTLVPYIGALESLRDSIDLQNLATAGIEELSELRVELDRLNSLAQLGIAVEIVGHELQSFDDIIASGLRALPDEIRRSKAAKDIEFGYEGITDQLRFLSPLRLAGERIEKWISGEEIRAYLQDFFDLTLQRNRIKLTADPAFLKFRVFDQQSRLFPVFINLVNNSLYWVATSETADREIRLSVADGRVVVSDTGPGVASEDVESLFSLFFTRRARGGRGVGLYLSRANLAAGGHRIGYVTDGPAHVLSGANFAIEFRGGEFE